ncbi:glutaredoxin [bacterium]|nr:glutaredoxin [bacterium]
MNRILIIFAALLFSVSFATPVLGEGENSDVTIYFFGRDDCSFCAAEKEFLTDFIDSEESVTYIYKDVLDEPESKAEFEQVIEKHGLSYVTPMLVIGDDVIQGYNAPETTGVLIHNAVERARTSDIKTLDDHLARAQSLTDIENNGGCDENGETCGTTRPANSFIFKLPLLGVVDLESFSLFTLSAVLGVIDGFNPCAMWVLITFLVLLSQAGSKKRMIYIAGLFMLAEAIMYNLILNVWFTAWDFVGLDAIVTPLVGFLAVGGGVFFLYRWHKNKNKPLVCDISDLESQAKTTSRIQELITSPVSIGMTLGIIGVAFSVNIIEFACSIGIPQAYTKILELNSIDFITRQWYLLVYTVGYMVDDIIVFGLAIWGFSKLESHGHKYSQLSLIIGGVLMLILGAILVFNPALLVL